MNVTLADTSVLNSTLKMEAGAGEATSDLVYVNMVNCSVSPAAPPIRPVPDALHTGT